MKEITLLDKTFELYLPSEKIQEAIKRVAQTINSELGKEDVVFLAVLNGSFLFAADLYRRIEFNSIISFIKLASYQGTQSVGNVKNLIGINEDLQNKTVIILEDIIDTGHTIKKIIELLAPYQPKNIKIATLLFKPGAYTGSDKIDYIGIEIPNDFIVGYGLDYEGYGRNLEDIYQIKN